MPLLRNNDVPAGVPDYQDDWTGAPEISSLILAVVERRIGDACKVAREQVLPQRVAGTVRQLVEDAAAWLYEVEDMPADLPDRLEAAVWEVARDI